MCTKRNMYGREYQQCIGLSTDFRSLLIQDLIDRGCDNASGKVPWGALSAIAKKFKVSVKTVIKSGHVLLSTEHAPKKCETKADHVNLQNQTKDLLNV